MSRRKRGGLMHDESGNPVESPLIGDVERKPRSNRNWTVQGLLHDGSSCEVVAEGLTKGQAEKMVRTSAPLLRKLYKAVRLVKVAMGEQYDL